MKKGEKKIKKKELELKISNKKLKEQFNKEIGTIKENFLLGGGFGGIGSALGDILSALRDIGNAIIGAFKYLVTLVKLIIWSFKFIIFILSEVLWPPKIIEDIAASPAIARQLIKVIKLLIVKFGTFLTNNLIGSISNKIFGWDLKKKPAKTNEKDTKCYKTKEGEVPMNILIATVLLPPLGVFMEFGLASWTNILITGGLTMLFYVPGLIYALILIYN